MTDQNATMTDQDATMTDQNDTRIAIIGMAGRFPGADSVPDLWRQLCAGQRGIRRFTAPELAAAGVPSDLAGSADYVPVGPDLPGIEDFDADFFGIPHHEARLIDPQHRFFLESAWQALEDAGHDPARTSGRVGVFGATGLSSYLHLIAGSGELPADGISYPVLLGNDKDFLCTRVSYRLNLTGPSITVQTACSASLVAVHLAVQSLLAGECEIALAGGVSLVLPGQIGHLYRDGGILSRDGHCRVFDASAGGTVRGSGCGVVVLRPLADAIADHDGIVAVIAGTAVNNDGSNKVGFTAPGMSGQVAAIREALAVADLPASDVDYVEAHGTGTALGDPIEVRSLAAAHAATGAPPERCRLGSIKANLGHLDTAAGIAGLIKTALVLREQTVPVQVDFATPNPAMAQHLATYQVPRETVRPAEGVRAAAVSSFGIGGTNAHAVLVPAGNPAGGGWDGDRRPAPSTAYRAVFSARDADSLRLLLASVQDRLRATPPPRLDDVAFTLAAGRVRYAVRAAFVVDGIPALVDAIDGYLAAPDRHRDTAPAGGSAGPAVGSGSAVDPVVARWLAGGDVTAEEVGDTSQGRRIGLPGHPLRRRRHWVDPVQPASGGRAGEVRVGGTPAAPAADLAEPANTADLADLAGIAHAVTADLLKVDGVPADADLYDLGLDSLQAVDLVTTLRDRTGRQLRFEEFDGTRTLADIVAMLERLEPSAQPSAQASAQPSAQPSARRVDQVGPAVQVGPVDRALVERYRHLLTRVRRGDGDRHVVLVHPAGGSVTPYADLARHTTGPATMWALGFPAQDAELFPTLRDAARLYSQLVRAVLPDGPYLLGGYSFGGNVAFEMALMLEAAGEKVDQIIMFDSHPPESYLGGRADDSDFLAAFPALVAEILPEVAPPSAAAPRTLAEATAMVRHPSWSDAAEAELTRFFTVWQRNHEALKRWYPDSQVRANVAMLAASDPENPVILDRLAITWHDRHTWARHIAGELTIRSVPGDHYSMFRDAAHLAPLALAYDAVVES